jgi:signal transduction histidine kinase
MLREQGDDLADFLATDPRGQKIPPYFVSLCDHLVNEQEIMKTQVAALERHVEHVRDIIHLQQDYSRTRGLTESVPIQEIIDDALRLNSEQNAKYGIEIQTSYQFLPPCWVDRHRLLQILINLLSNAHHALIAHGQSPQNH